MNDDLKLFNELVELLFTYEQQNPVANPISTDKLYQNLDLKLNDEPALEEHFRETLSKIIKSTPKTATTYFFNQLYGGRLSRATLGDLLAVMLNNSMYTYKVAGPHVGIEKTILHKICEIIGYGKNSDGAFAPGGSMSNFMAMLMARDKHNSNVRNEGVHSKMIVYTSEESHYSIPKNASLMGIGRGQVRFVKVDSFGKMMVQDLEYHIKRDLDDGYEPFFVNVTAGTTVLGAFDDVISINEICKKYKLWLHVDGAYCGSVIFSKKHKHLVKGLELSDSFSVNAHKMLGTPLTCSIIVTQDRRHLHQSFSTDAEYLYQTDDDEFNPGKTSLQCGRRNDALKLWTLWKSVGTTGLEKIVNNQFKLADVARNYIRNHDDYELYSFDESISVCFNYKNVNAKKLCTLLYEHGELMVGFGTFEGNEFIRLVTINSSLEEKDMINFFHVIEDFANEHISSL